MCEISTYSKMPSNLKRRTYQRLDGQIKDFGQYRKDLLKIKVNLGILENDILESKMNF